MRPTNQRNNQTERVMSFGEHLDELRRRLMIALVGIAPILIVSMYFADWFMNRLTEPLIEQQLAARQSRHMQVTGLLEHFNAYFYVGLVMTLLIGAPWLLYQLWLFIAPGLYLRERRFVHILAPMSIVLTLVSAAFTYWVMLPAILQFFSHWNATVAAPAVATAAAPAGTLFGHVPVLSADPIAPAIGDTWVNSTINEYRVCVGAAEAGSGGATGAQVLGMTLEGDNLLRQDLRISQYIDMVFNFTLAFAAGFQMPVVVLLLGWIGIVKVEFLRKYRKHALFACAVLGAVLTPGDPLSAALLGVPLYVLYEFGILMLHWLPASRVRGEKPTVEGEAALVKQEGSETPT